MCLTSQPLSRNSAASQSSSSGCDRPLALGAEVVDDRALRPVPKNCFQSRLTNTRAVSGFSGETSQRARSSRVSRCSRLLAGLRQELRGTRAATIAPVSSCQLPRGRTRVISGFIGLVTMDRRLAVAAFADRRGATLGISVEGPRRPMPVAEIRPSVPAGPSLPSCRRASRA